MGQSISARYFELLGCRSRQEIETRIVEAVLLGVRRAGRSSPPISLSQVAPVFAIDPTPVWDDGEGEAQMLFDRTRDKFIIRLGTVCNTTGLRQGILWANMTQDRPRQRFTYAHEMAHRFFFLPQGNEWVRALDLVVEKLRGVEKLRSFRILARLEEQACNKIAARLLVPDNELARFVESWGESTILTGSFPQMIGAGAKTFGVSRECWIAALKDATDRRAVALPDGFAAMLVLRTNRRASWRTPRHLPRIIFPIVSMRLENRSVRPAFPGMTLRALTPEADALAAELFVETPGRKGGHLDIPVSIRIRSGGDGIRQFKFVGWWKRFREFGHDRTALLWGSLSPRDHAAS